VKFSGWLLSALGGAAFAGETALPHDVPGGLLVTDSLGRRLAVSTNDAHPTYHKDAYALEACYVRQLTPVMTLQPHLQVVWNPAFNPSTRSAMVVARLQLNLVW
jgi:hypothetical protein